MKSILITIIILFAIGFGLYFLLDISGSSDDLFVSRELRGKLVYEIVDGEVSDLRVDCIDRGGIFNTCGSMCEAGEICATVCTYTCELNEDDEDLDLSVKVDSEVVENNDTNGDVVNRNENIECGTKPDGVQVRCPFDYACFTFEGSAPACAKDPCSVCTEDKSCQVLESYPVQVKCIDELEDSENEEELLGNTTKKNIKTSKEIISVVGNGVKVTSPTLNQQLVSPISISGETSMLNDDIVVQILSESGNVLIEEITKAHNSGVNDLGLFTVKVNYIFSTTKEGFVKIFPESFRNSTGENTVKIPVKF